MSVHSATGYHLCPVGLTCCDVTTGKLQFNHAFIMCKKLKKKNCYWFGMQQLPDLHCDWTYDG